jgi:hypothetical protein
VAELSKYHVVIFQEREEDSLNIRLVRKIEALLEKKIVTPPESTQIDVWLDSPGGSAHAAYKLILALRSRCNVLWTIIPDYAKSAATLLVLGSDCIFMAPTAELGPLDVQIDHPDRENVRISGLDVTNSLEHLTTMALNFTLVGGGMMLKYTGLPRRDVLHELLQFMAQALGPLISKLDPHIIHQATNELKVAEQYALRMLKMRNLPKEKQLSDDDAEAVLETLVKEYPTHSFVISREEAAKELGLPVKCAIKNYEKWTYVKQLYEYSSKQGQTLVNVFLDSEVDDNMASEQVEDNNETCSQDGNGKE